MIDHFDAIILWDFRQGKTLKRIPKPRAFDQGGGYGSLMGALSSDGKTLFRNRGYLQRWDLEQGKSVFEAPTEILQGQINRLAFLNGGNEIFASAGSLNSVLWETATRQQREVAEWDLSKRLLPTPDGLRHPGGNLDTGEARRIIRLLFSIRSAASAKTIKFAEPKESDRTTFAHF